jgi:hypothetical protein
MTATTLLLAALCAAAEPGHAANEKVLLHAAFPDYDEKTTSLGENEGWLMQTASICESAERCYLVAAAIETGPARGDLTGRHPWTTLYALKVEDGSATVEAHAPGPVVSSNGAPSISLSVKLEGKSPTFTIVGGTTSAQEGNASTTTVLYWDGAAFQRILAATSVQAGGQETEARVITCAGQGTGRPTYEVRTREREGRGGWVEALTRYTWAGTAYQEGPATRSCTGEAVAQGPAAVGGGDTGTATASASPSPSASASAPSDGKLIRAATASHAMAPQKGGSVTFVPDNAIDGDVATAWAPGGKKNGIGEWLQLDFAKKVVLKSVRLTPGCGDTAVLWKNNPRLKRLRFRFDDGKVQDVALKDGRGDQTVTIKRTASTGSLRIEVVETYPGAKARDACLAEVTVLPR